MRFAVRYSKPTTQIFVALLPAILLPTSLKADGEQDRVMKELPAALKRLESAFSRATGVVRWTDSRGTPGKESEWHSRAATIEFAFDGPNSKAIYAYDSVPGENRPYRLTLCTTPNSGFVVRQATKDAAPVLTALAIGKEDKDIRTLEQFRGAVLKAPLGGTSDLSRLWHAPGFAIDDVTSEREGALTLYRVRFHQPIRFAGKELPATGFFLASPDESWVVREYERRVGAGRYGGKIEYEGKTKDGIPLPKRVVNTHPEMREEYEFVSLSLDASPPETFRLVSAGMPDLESRIPAASQSRFRPAYWLLGGAIVALAAAIAIRIAGQSRVKTKSTN